MDNHQPSDRVADHLVDLLVDGELADSERRELLLRLENETGGWRRCALAFLEAQDWRDAFRSIAAPTSARPVALSEAQRRDHRFRHPLIRVTGFAAGILAAFALGWGLRGQSNETATFPVVVQRPVPDTKGIGQESPPPPGDLATPRSTPADPERLSALLDPVVKQWEQRGYSAETQSKLLSMELKDGRKVQVPVHEVRLRYVAGRTY
jgi:hypothetical protein